MAGSLNCVMLIGNLGKDPEVNIMTNGGQVVKFSIATSESWKDKQTGEKREKTEWHNIVIFNEGLGKVAAQYLHKGSKCFVQGKMQTRKWQDQEGKDRYSTEVVLGPFNAQLALLDGKNADANRSANNGEGTGSGSTQPSGQRKTLAEELDDEIPF